MGTKYAGNTYHTVEELRQVIQVLLDMDVPGYKVFTDRSGLYFDVHWVSPYTLATKLWSVPAKDLQQVLLFSRDDLHAANMVKDYLWEEKLPVGFNKQEVNSNLCLYHEWEEVTLFRTVQERCKHCDIKKPVEG